MKTLDVGCGTSPRGDVNIDIFPKTCNQSRTFDPKQIKNFVLADAYHLPFRNNIFTYITCTAVVEHLQSPIKALKEMNRACNGKVYVQTPSQFCLDKSKEHIYTWNPVTLKNLLELVFEHVEVTYSTRYPLIAGKLRKYLPLLIVILSKLGFHPHLHAICRTNDEPEIVSK